MQASGEKKLLCYSIVTQKESESTSVTAFLHFYELVML